MKHLPFKIIALSVFIILIVPLCIQDGMFMDGIIYAAISKNLANGIGSFWFPVFSENDLIYYHDQLPLFFGIQSLFFRILGNSLYVERFFSFLMACITAFFIVKIWRLVFSDNAEIKQAEWLPILFWITCPICYWSYINNVEEILMGVFSSASVYLILKGLKADRNRIIFLVAGGVCIFLCGFCKGIQGLFPLVIVILYWAFLRKIPFKKMVVYTLIILLVPVIITGILMLNDNAHQSIMANLDRRLSRTFNGNEVATVGDRFYLVKILFLEFVPVLILTLFSYIFYRYLYKGKKPDMHFKYAGFFIAIGLCGSLPLLITLEQRRFYLCTTLPFFALGLSLIAVSFIAPLISRISAPKKGFKIFRISTFVILLFAVVFSLMQIGKIKRDKDELHDVYLVGKMIPARSIISVPLKLREEFALRAYFVRYFNIYWDVNNNNPHEYYFTSKEIKEPIPESYHKIDLNLKNYDLYKK